MRFLLTVFFVLLPMVANGGLTFSERKILEDIDVFMRYRNLTKETN